MEYRKMANLGISTSLLGFGCMRFPTNADGSIDEKEALAMIDTAYQSGVTYFDTAYPYHGECLLLIDAPICICRKTHTAKS